MVHPGNHLKSGQIVFSHLNSDVWHQRRASERKWRRYKNPDDLLTYQSLPSFFSASISSAKSSFYKKIQSSFFKPLKAVLHLPLLYQKDRWHTFLIFKSTFCNYISINFIFIFIPFAFLFHPPVSQSSSNLGNLWPNNQLPPWPNPISHSPVYCSWPSSLSSPILSTLPCQLSASLTL